MDHAVKLHMMRLVTGEYVLELPHSTIGCRAVQFYDEAKFRHNAISVTRYSLIDVSQCNLS